jgi:hypothetical protein
MSMPDLVLRKLYRMQQLRIELERTSVDSPRYEALVKESRVLFEEYEALIAERGNRERRIDDP